MGLKKVTWLAIFLLLLMIFPAFASDPDISGSSEETEVIEVDKSTTQIVIENADSLYTKDNLVVLSGNVVISFQQSNSSKKSLKANKVVVELDKKVMEASGDVTLEDSQQGARSFSGQSVLFDWSNLDVVVFSGISYTERKNSTGSVVSLYASGDTVSYDGNENIIFFNKGTISTALEDPYWSISASKISFAGSDVFVDNAVFKLGRVPIFYFPVFFYPGTTLSFNPAIGLSSDKGSFINTTTELYGVYTGIGSSSSSSSASSSSDSGDSISASDYSASLLSMLDDGDASEKIKDGVVYRKVEEGEDLGSLETWARKTGSYFAFFADAYQDLGLALGYDTYNSFWDGMLKLNSTGLFAYNASDSREFAKTYRYYVNLGLKFNFSVGSLSLSMPLYSDYSVARDFLNRNTVFGLDSVLGANQTFPSTYNTVKSYSWSLNGNLNYKLGNISLNLSSLKAEINFNLESSLVDGKYSYTPKVTSASLPSLSFSSNGSWTRTFEKKAEDKPEESTQKQTEEASTESTVDKVEITLMPYAAPSVKTTEKASTNASINFGYTFSESLDNKFIEDLTPSSFYTNSNGSLYFNGQSPDTWFSISETIKPQYSFSAENLNTQTSTKINNLSFTSTLVAKLPFLGLTYRLSNKLYSLNTKEVGSTITTTSGWGQWQKTDVTEHSLEFSKSLWAFTFGLKGTFKPVTQSIKPSVAFSLNGYKASADLTFTEKNEALQASTGNLSLGYSNSNFSFSLKNTYSFENIDDANLWKNYSLTENASAKFFSGNLTLTQSASFKEKFVPYSLNCSVSHLADLSWISSKGSLSMSFKRVEDEFKAEVLKVNLDNDLSPIYFWKNRIGIGCSVDFSFVYNFINPYNTSFTVSFNMEFEIAEFLALNISVNSSNKSFYRYFTNGVDGLFDFDSMLEDLAKSFDFFENGRKSTGFNLSSYKIELVHYMRDWNACLSAEGKLSARNDGKLVWSPVYKFYVKWNAIPELKVEKTYDTSKEDN